MDLFKVV